MVETDARIECSFCGDPLDGEESESPRIDDDDGQSVCDECYHEHFEFTCCCCKEYGDVKDQHNLLVVFEEVSSYPDDVLPGIYKIVDGPYYSSCMIGGGSLHKSCLERIADVNPGMDGDGCPCGHLCLECQKKVLAQFFGMCTRCNLMSNSCLRVQLGSWKDFEAKEYQWTPEATVCATCRHAHRGSWQCSAAKGWNYHHDAEKVK